MGTESAFWAQIISRSCQPITLGKHGCLNINTDIVKTIVKYLSGTVKASEFCPILTVKSMATINFKEQPPQT